MPRVYWGFTILVIRLSGWERVVRAGGAVRAGTRVRVGGCLRGGGGGCGCGGGGFLLFHIFYKNLFIYINF